MSVPPKPPSEPEELAVPELDPLPDPVPPDPDPEPPPLEPEPVDVPELDAPLLEVDDPPLDPEPLPPEPDVDDVVASAPEELGPLPPPEPLDPLPPSLVVELQAATIVPAPVDESATYVRSDASFMVIVFPVTWSPWSAA
jgi:hypothetical protein